jgi:HD-like signal output (HDOD) protein
MSFIRLDRIHISPEDLLEGDLNLVSPPEIYTRLNHMLADPDVSMVMIAEVIERDPGLAMRVLRLANSAFFSLPSPVGSIHEAISFLGMQHVQDIVLATEVIQRFEAIPAELVDIYSFWRDSMRCAALSRHLSENVNGKGNEQMFLAGLLHRIGHLVMYQRIPELARKALLEHRYRNLPIHEVERDLMGFDYAELGATLARQWQLPGFLCSVIAHQNSPLQALDFPAETALLALASTIAELRTFDYAMIKPALIGKEELCSLSGLELQDLPEIIVQAERSYGASLALLH